MALPLLVSVVDFASAIGEDHIEPDDGRAVNALRGASARVRSYTGRTWVDPDSGDLLTVPDAVVQVVIAAAERKWTNPRGYIQDTTGPFTVRLPERAGDGIYLTEGEQSDLNPYRLARRGLYSRRLTKDDPFLDDIATDTVWVGTRYTDGSAGEAMPWIDSAELGDT